jgi:hypothetical protein
MYFFLLVFSLTVFAQDSFMQHEIEDEHQLDFPGLDVQGSESQSFPFFAINLGKGGPNKLVFDKITTLKAGAKVKISSYVISKNLQDQLKNYMLSQKIDLKAFKNALNARDAKKIHDFMLKLSEKVEVHDGAKNIPTGMIEVLPQDSQEFTGKADTRFFIPLNKIKDLQLDASGTIAKLLNSVTLLSFKSLERGLNYGSLSKAEISALTEAKDVLTNDCKSCALNSSSGNLGDLTVSILEIGNYDVLSDPVIDLNDSKSYVLLQQACVLNLYLEQCSSPKLESVQKKILDLANLNKLVGGQKLGDFCRKKFKP